MMKSLKWMTPFVFLLASGEVIAAKPILVKDIQSPAKEVNLVIGNSVARKAFSFSGGTAWLDAEGNFHVEMLVTHQKLRCAQYQTGIQFGIGIQHCGSATWLLSPHMVTDKKQCNNSKLVHTGGSWLEELSTKYQGVSCARIQVYCNGKGC